MRSIGVFGEPVCKCAGVCVCLWEVQSRWDQIVKGGLGVLSIGTAPPRARWTEGMRYIVKPKSKISAEKRKKPSRPCSGASSHPLRTEVSLRNVRNLSRTKKTKRLKKRRGLSFCLIPWTTLPASTQTWRAVSNPIYQNQVTTKPTSGM